MACAVPRGDVFKNHVMSERDAWKRIGTHNYESTVRLGTLILKTSVLSLGLFLLGPWLICVVVACKSVVVLCYFARLVKSQVSSLLTEERKSV